MEHKMSGSWQNLSIKAEKRALHTLRLWFACLHTSNTSNAIFSPSLSQSSHNIIHWHPLASSSSVLLISNLSYKLPENIIAHIFIFFYKWRLNFNHNNVAINQRRKTFIFFSLYNIARGRKQIQQYLTWIQNMETF